MWRCSYRSISVHQSTSPSSSPSTLTGMRAFLVCLMEFILVVMVRSLMNWTQSKKASISALGHTHTHLSCSEAVWFEALLQSEPVSRQGNSRPAGTRRYYQFCRRSQHTCSCRADCPRNTVLCVPLRFLWRLPLLGWSAV